MNEMLEKIKKTREYLDYVEEHYRNVQTAWEWIQKDCKDMNFMIDDYVWNMIDNSVKNHDLSKLSKEEFVQYRENFFPINDEEKEQSDFDSAWENHQKKNLHHWQNWIPKEKNFPHAHMYLVDNIVDWVAMGIKFGDTAKAYYEKNKHNIPMPYWAETLMYEIFDRIYN